MRDGPSLSISSLGAFEGAGSAAGRTVTSASIDTLSFNRGQTVTIVGDTTGTALNPWEGGQWVTSSSFTLDAEL